MSNQNFEVGDIVEILPCPLAETFDIVGKTAKVNWSNNHVFLH